jgi:serine protease AprX
MAAVTLLALAAASLGVATADPAQATRSARASAPAAQPTARVIIRAATGQLDAVTSQVRQLNGTITQHLPIINGIAATLPVTTVTTLRTDHRVLAITPDATGRVQAINPALGYDQTDTGSLDQITTLIGARALWSAGWTGKGIDVALIDTGVAQVTGLTTGNIINGPDLSTDQMSTDLRYRDSYGHGTHMASLIAGRDTISTPTGYTTSSSKYQGVAPDARIINLKVGATDGAADVSQVIAAIGWVTQHAHDNGLNIRVLNLSYGTTSTQDYTLDPLTYAVEAAWRKGITVVVAAGNDGTTKAELANPAQDPNVIAVGAEDPNGTLTTTDDTIPDFSNRGTQKRHVDITAPGTHVLGLRVPGSVIDQANPTAVVGTRFLRGSGTSQATAITSGAIALLLQARPGLTPDQIKWLLTNSATALPKGTTQNRGAGLINATSALKITALPTHASLIRNAVYGTGTGSLEEARGGSHLVDGTTAEVPLTGEKDIFGTPWDGQTWAPAALAGTAWNGGSWRGNTWTGGAFNANGDWTGANWTTSSWTGDDWYDLSWVGRSWVGRSWVGDAWVNTSWSGRSWVGASWAGSIWG